MISLIRCVIRYYAKFRDLIRVSLGVYALQKENLTGSYSFFHPKAFESGIAEYLTSLYAHRRSKKQAVWRAPVNWQSLLNNQAPMATFYIEPESEGITDWRRILIAPLSNSTLVCFEFLFRLYREGTLDEIKNYYNPKNMEEFSDRIVQSVEFQYHGKQKTEIDEVAKTCPDMDLTESFPPLDWSNANPEANLLGGK